MTSSSYHHIFKKTPFKKRDLINDPFKQQLFFRNFNYKQEQNVKPFKQVSNYTSWNQKSIDSVVKN